MSKSADRTYVVVDDHGVHRVGGTRVSLDSIIVRFQQGDTPEAIQQQYPAVNLESVYGAIAYYLAHREEVDEYLRRQERVWEDWQGKLAQEENPVVERLRAQIKAETAG